MAREGSLSEFILVLFHLGYINLLIFHKNNFTMTNISLERIQLWNQTLSHCVVWVK